MRDEIRQRLAAAGFTTAKEEKMETPPNGFTFEQVLELARTIAAEQNKMNPLQQKEYDDKIAAEKRKAMMVVELGKAEEQSMMQKRHGCSHSRHGMAAGKLAGHACARGAGEWTTGGQLHGDGAATLICTRCSWTWRWHVSPQEREYIENSGMMGMAPPAEDRLIQEPELAVKSH